MKKAVSSSSEEKSKATSDTSSSVEERNKLLGVRDVGPQPCASIHGPAVVLNEGDESKDESLSEA